MANTGARLREERERLKLTQDSFAIACGVSRRAQVTYEADERSPDARYLEAASKFGVDIAYVVYGARTDFKETIRSVAIEDLLFCICFELGFDNDHVKALISQSIHVVTGLYARGEDAGGGAPYLVESVETFLDKSARISPNLRTGKKIDSDFLALIIERVDSALLQKQKTLPVKKKALIISMLYQAGENSGVIDENILDNFIALAVA